MRQVLNLVNQAVVIFDPSRENRSKSASTGSTGLDQAPHVYFSNTKSEKLFGTSLVTDSMNGDDEESFVQSSMTLPQFLPVHFVSPTTRDSTDDAQLEKIQAHINDQCDALSDRLNTKLISLKEIM